MFILWVANSNEGGNLKPHALFGVQASGDGHMERTFQPPIRVPPCQSRAASAPPAGVGVREPQGGDEYVVHAVPGKLSS